MALAVARGAITELRTLAERKTAFGFQRPLRERTTVQANLALGGYEVFQAQGNLPDPVWPDQPFGYLLRTAFKDRFIKTLDHPMLRRLRGEV